MFPYQGGSSVPLSPMGRKNRTPVSPLSWLGVPHLLGPGVDAYDPRVRQVGPVSPRPPASAVWPGSALVCRGVTSAAALPGEQQITLGTTGQGVTRDGATPPCAVSGAQQGRAPGDRNAALCAFLSAAPLSAARRCPRPVAQLNTVPSGANQVIVRIDRTRAGRVD